MEFLQLLRRSSGCASYLIGSAESGACAVVDPAWETEQYLRAAEERGLRITHILESHAHADHLSGARRLAAQSGAAIYAHPDFGAAFPMESLRDGALISLGEVAITALHTPGHRPDCLCLLVTDEARGHEPWLVLTGDTLFIGDAGRPDLGQQPHEAARRLYHSLFDGLLKLPDWVEVYPAHVAGSPCGRSMSPKGSSTLGFERLFNPALQARSLDEFVEKVVSDLPPQPPNFLTIVEKNRGMLPVREGQPRPLSPGEVLERQRAGAWVVDLRDAAAFGASHIQRSLNVPLRQGHFPTSAGWSVPPEEPMIVVVEQPGDLPEATGTLTSAGLDWVEGYLNGGIEAWRKGGQPLASMPQMPIESLERVLDSLGGPVLVDVRSREEWARGHIPGAVSIPLHELDPHRPVAFVCGSGINSAVAASKAKAQGYESSNVAGGTSAWVRAGHQVERAEGA